MKMLVAAAITALILGLFCSPGETMDYADMSNDELAELRGAIRNAPAEERQAYEIEWEKRQARMSEAERRHYSGGEEQGTILPQPHVQGRGYDQQGMGSVIQGSR